ncbi:MAG: cell division protein ZapA [Acidobacteriota bacterium]|jgi:cell division protein ZapA|nr:cell division protein ZapA [Acidobacteriota bacterium]
MSEPQEPKSVSARIYDREYVLRTDGDPARLKAICALVDKRMRDVAAATGAVDTLKVAVLAALSIADDVSRAKDETARLDEAVGKRSTACIAMLERLFSQGASD